MDLDGAHQEDSCATKSVISRCWTMCIRMAIIFLLTLFLCPTKEDLGMLMSSVVINAHMCGLEGGKKGQ
jgi:hypothetical protein